jgi:predicted ATP-grasp superfamily ATP-dependent carboligase
MLQEYISGTDRDSWMMDAYFDRDGRCAFGVTARKLRQYPAEGGVTSLGECVPNAELEAAVLRFAELLGYRGILDTGYRFDARDGQYKLLDPNPRIGSSFRLFVSPEGMDVVRALYLDMTDQPVPSTAHPEGRRWFAEPSEVRRAVRMVRRSRSPHRIPAWAASFWGVRETAWFGRDDMRPFLAMCRRLAQDALDIAARRSEPAPPPAQSAADPVAVEGGSAT